MLDINTHKQGSSINGIGHQFMWARMILAAVLIWGILAVPLVAISAPQQRTGVRRKRPPTRSRPQQTKPATPPAVATPTAPRVIEIPSDRLLPAPTSLPNGHAAFHDVGHRCAIIFTPDLAGEANRTFYQALGFLYLEHANWKVVLEELIAYNSAHRDKPITRVLLETHGNWGNGLKLQDGKEEQANRSYISLGALQEQLEGSGVEQCIISACNSGRLYRPEIYRRLSTTGLLPANFGIINASRNYKPSPTAVKILRREESRYEALTPLFISELPKPLRRHIGGDGQAQFIVSDLFLEYVLNDPNLKLIETGFVRQVSIRDYSVDRSEALILRFLQMLEQIASIEKDGEQLADRENQPLSGLEGDKAKKGE
ncbi:MAG: hypothetical protein AB1489_13645 [Acidobacteriota bacterium]